MRRTPTRGTLNAIVACLLLPLLVQQGDAFFFVNYQQQQQQQPLAQPPPQPPPPPLQQHQSQNPLGFLPNGYNLASGLPIATQPPQYQQQLANQLNQLPASNPNQLYSNNPSAESSPPAANEIDEGTSNKQFESQYGRASSSIQSLNQQQQQTDSRLDRIGPSSMSDREATPVFRFTGQALNSTSVKLVWSMTTGYQADFFEIRYGPIPDTESKSATLNGTARELTVSLLQPNEMYHFKLQAFVNGSPVWKPLLQVIRTPPAGNLKPGQLQEDRELTPLGVKAEAKSNQTIQLSWIEQERPAHLTNAKRVNYIRYHVDPTMSQEAAASGTNASTAIRYHYLNTTEAANRDNRIIIQKLKPATEYAFAVRTVYFSPDGKKALKTSPFSMDTLAKTFDLEPSPPRNFSMMPVRLSPEESRGGELIPKLELTWAPPESPNGQLKGYVILYAHDLDQPDEKWARIYVNDSNIFNWYVSNLRPGASYYFKMRSINQRGQSGDTETRMFMAPSGFPGLHLGQPPPIPANNILMLIVICLVAILFVLFLVVSRLFCRSHRSHRKLAAQRKAAALQKQQHQQSQDDKLVNGYGIIAPPQHVSNNSSSTVTGRVGTLARRSNRQQAGDKPDFWISAMDQQAAAAASSDIKSNMSDKSNAGDSNINMQAMVSIRRDSPQQFTAQTTQLAPMMPEYRFTPNEQQQQLMQQIHQQQQSHYHTGHQFPAGTLGHDQMDNATASALMTLSKRQQQQLQKYHFQFASGGPGGTMNPSSHSTQAASPHQQPPPPPPLNIEQQQAQQQQQQQQLHNQPLYGTHGPLNSTRSLRLHRPPVYDPVSGSFVQPAPQDPPNYNSHLNSMLGAAHHQLQSFNSNAGQVGSVNTSTGSNTLQFHHPHSTSTLMSRRSTNTLRSFQSAAGAGSLYGQLGNANSFAPASQNDGVNQGPQLLQNHQAVINQLNDSTYPSMPLKHVSTVRPQIMSSLEDQIEMELAEKQAEQKQQQQQQQQQQDQNS